MVSPGKTLASLGVTLLFCATCLAQGEQQETAPVPQQSAAQQTDVPQQVPAGSANIPDAQINKATQPKKTSGEQPKRILGVMPNYRAVSAGAIPPPPTAKEAFKIATQNSFDYSALIFVGITSLMAEGSNAHPQLHKGVEGYGRYYWRGFVDKTDGNYLVIFALPTLFHEDERYFAMGTGGWFKRAIYSASRILITPDYNGHNTFNAAEIFGRGISQGISGFYYPSQDRTAGALAVKYGWAIGRDALTNVFREFWPDISSHVLHRHPKTDTPTP
jgi:subtilisin family serine protease